VLNTTGLKQAAEAATGDQFGSGVCFLGFGVGRLSSSGRQLTALSAWAATFYDLTRVTRGF
jgi:hypothetical protein